VLFLVLWFVLYRLNILSLHQKSRIIGRATEMLFEQRRCYPP